jgi:hypothetical protein
MNGDIGLFVPFKSQRSDTHGIRPRAFEETAGHMLRPQRRRTPGLNG